MINAPCVITADFESDNIKCNESYGGKMRKISEQKANSFCYTVYWIDTNDLWGPFIYRGPNATEEFVKGRGEIIGRSYDFFCRTGFSCTCLKSAIGRQPRTTSDLPSFAACWKGRTLATCRLKMGPPTAFCHPHPSFKVKKGVHMYAFPCACWKKVYVKQCTCPVF